MYVRLVVITLCTIGTLGSNVEMNSILCTEFFIIIGNTFGNMNLTYGHIKEVNGLLGI